MAVALVGPGEGLQGRLDCTAQRGVDGRDGEEPADDEGQAVEAARLPAAGGAHDDVDQHVQRQAREGCGDNAGRHGRGAVWGAECAEPVG